MHGIVGKMWVGDMALLTFDDQRGVDGTRRPFLTISPNVDVLEGSPTTHQSMVSPRDFSVSTT